MQGFYCKKFTAKAGGKRKEAEQRETQRMGKIRNQSPPKVRNGRARGVTVNMVKDIREGKNAERGIEQEGTEGTEIRSSEMESHGPILCYLCYLLFLLFRLCAFSSLRGAC